MGAHTKKKNGLKESVRLKIAKKIQLGSVPNCTFLSAEVIVHDRSRINTQVVQHTGNGL